LRQLRTNILIAHIGIWRFLKLKKKWKNILINILGHVNMLRVTIELVPFGDESATKKIGEMVLANDATGRHNIGNYEAWTAPDNWSGEPARYGVVKNYDRDQSVWELVRLMLEAIRLEDHKPDTKLAELLKERLK
jgi:hypothetical protein